MRLGKFSLLAGILTVGLMVFHTGRAIAEMWVLYESESGIFTSRMPEENESKATEFMVDDALSVSSEEVSALIDQRPYKNALKGYIVRTDQTIGAGLNSKQVEVLLERELNLYEDFYVAHGGDVKNRKVETTMGNRMGELMISYNDPAFGEQIVRVKVIFSTSTRLEQILIAPADSINSMMTRDYFDSLTFEDGLRVSDKKLETVWNHKMSPLGLFTIGIPPVSDPYMPFEPKIKYSKNAESVTLLFKDPIRNEGLYYNVYGYHFNRNLSVYDAQNLLMKNHVAKHGIKPEYVRVTIDDKSDKKRKYYKMFFDIKPPAGFPYLQSVKINAVTEGQSMVVQEITTSQSLALAPFVDVLFKDLKFHPQHYHEPLDDEAVVEGAQGPHEMDIPTPDVPGGGSLAAKLRSTISTLEKDEKEKNAGLKGEKVEAPELKPLGAMPPEETDDSEEPAPAETTPAEPPPATP